jgi:hypothetical protein
MTIVYILTNTAMPGLIKIGRTDDLTSRLKQLYGSGVPLPFECFYAARVIDSIKVEKKLHIAFAPHRLNENREFFRLDPANAAAALELAEVENVTPGKATVENQQDLVALEKESQRAARFNFEMVGIKPGAVLTFVYDETVTCQVADKSRVVFEGVEMALSAAAISALQKIGKNWKSAQGANFWMYEGETLIDRRARMETEEG